MKTPSKVGVVVPTRNRIQRTKRFLSHFLNQTYVDFVIYFVDSNSTDGTSEWLANIKHSKIVHVSAGDEDYWTGATNRGVARALEDGCEYILTINDDSMPSDTLLETLINVMTNESWEILGSRVNFLEPLSLVWSVGSYNVWGSRRLFQLFDNEEAEEAVLLKYEHRKTVAVDLMCGNGVLIRRSTFEKIGFYDEEHCPHYHGDSEFVMRARKKDIRCGVCVDAVNYNDTSAYIQNAEIWQIENRWPFENVPYLKPAIKWIRKCDRLFIQRRSERRLATILFIIRQYGPPGQRITTFVRYFSHAIGTFLIPNQISYWRKRRVWLKKYIANSGLGLHLLLALRSLIGSRWRAFAFKIKLKYKSNSFFDI